MQTVYSPDHAAHRARSELRDGQLAPGVESPERAGSVLAAISGAGIGEVVSPPPIDPRRLRSVHDAGYLEFLATIWDAWSAEGRDWDALPLTGRARGMRSPRVPRAVDGRISHYSFDTGTPIGPGTHAAAIAAASCALHAGSLVAGGEPVAFALCRPPGHHALADQCGGYCFLNNAALAAQAFIDAGAGRVAVLDVDAHHGNGTQEIFYECADVAVANVHADPADEYPFFSGFADERGAGAGEGANLNLPLPLGADFRAYAPALDRALAWLDERGADALVVSLGLDAYRGDPLTELGLETADFARIGAAISRLRRPAVVVLEGGYAVDDLGKNCVAFFEGLLG
jgi:acetoin utilization deacetylase AcuC-like enzyme